MAKFCSNCGRPLQDGEVCNCQTQNNQTQGNSQLGQGQPYGQYNQGQPYGQYNQGQGQPYGQPGQGQPYGQPGQGQPYGQYNQGQPYGQYNQGQPYGQPQPQAPAQPSAAGIYFKELWRSIIGSYQKPSDTLPGLTKEPKTGVLLGILGIQAVLFSLIFLFAGLKINGLTGGFIKLINTPLAFFMALLCAAVILAVWALISMLIVQGMAKKQMSYPQGLGVSAAKAVAQMPFTILSALIMLIFPLSSNFTLVLLVIVYEAGTLLSYFFVPVSMEGFLADNKNKRVWQLFVIFLINLLIGWVMMWIYGQVIGSGIASVISGSLF